MSRPGGKMLVVTFSYAPALNARAFRWTALAEHFAAGGWQVDVVSAWHAEAPAAETRRGVAVRRVGWAWAERARGLARRQQAQAPASSGAPSFPRRLWRQLYWPDFACLWYGPARRASTALLRAGGHDVVVSVSPAFTAVLAAQAARRGAPHCRWLIDIGDPFSLQEHAPPNNPALYGALNRRVERRALEEASAIAVTTARTAERYAAAFPEAAEKLQVIPPLLSIPDAAASPFRVDGAIRILYVGRLYRGLREPRFLLELFAALCAQRPQTRYELHLFGEAHEFEGPLLDWKRRLGERLSVHGVQSREATAAAVAGADVLVNLGNESADQLPSKVVEYAAAGKPILNLARQDDDVSSAFLRTYPDTLTLLDRGAAPDARQVEALGAFVREMPRALSAEQRERWISPYRLPAIAAQYEALLR
jgi:glycosyltransferase involved in cell wall biosynthesis